MSDKSNIEWTDATWNPVRGCSRVSEGCRNCYAERVAARFSGPGLPYEGLAKMTTAGARWTGEVRLIEDHLEDPLRWKRPRRIFVNSMSDLFHEDITDVERRLIFAIMLASPCHSFQVLTKRPRRMYDFFKANPLNECYVTAQHEDSIRRANNGSRLACLLRIYDHVGKLPAEWPLPNVWLGVSVEDQDTADKRIPWLLQTPAAIRWISYEPALGPIDFEHDTEVGILSYLRSFDFGDGNSPKLDWVVAGGESGPGARPMHPFWARSARDQCVAAGVPFFFKQWGEWAPASAVDHLQKLPGRIDHSYMNDAGVCSSFESNIIVNRVGKKAAGRLLDGRTWDDYPCSDDLSSGV